MISGGRLEIGCRALNWYVKRASCVSALRAVLSARLAAPFELGGMPSRLVLWLESEICKRTRKSQFPGTLRLPSFIICEQRAASEKILHR